MPARPGSPSSRSGGGDRPRREGRGDRPARAGGERKPGGGKRPPRRDAPPAGRGPRPEREDQGGRGPRAEGRPPRRDAPAADRAGRPARRDAPISKPRPAEDDQGARGKRGDGRPTGQRRVDKAVIWKPGPSARVVGAEAGSDLAHFIALGGEGQLSVRAIRRALDAGSCRVNGMVERYGSRQLKRGDVVEFYIPTSLPRDHDFDPARVLWNADDILAYDKPAGLPVTPDDQGRKWNLQSLLRAKFPDIIAVHRLDADTSGVVLFARAEKVARALEDAFREHKVKKTYLALVRGHPRETGEHRSYLVKVASQKGHELWASGKGRDAREAITTWKLEERVGAYASLMRIEPQTGRHHQIRIHFSEIGHPIYGDRLYGDRADPIHVTRHLLHAWNLELPRPDGRGQIVITTPFPAEFDEAMKLLRKV